MYVLKYLPKFYKMLYKEALKVMLLHFGTAASKFLQLQLPSRTEASILLYPHSLFTL